MCQYAATVRCYPSQGWQHDREGVGEVRILEEEGNGECVSSSGQVSFHRPLTTAVLHAWWKPCAAIFVPQWWGGTNGHFHTSWCHQCAAPGEQDGGSGRDPCWELLLSISTCTHMCTCSYIGGSEQLINSCFVLTQPQVRNLQAAIENAFSADFYEECRNLRM